nr:hypothetical protein [Mycoplasmopsis bovis]
MPNKVVITGFKDSLINENIIIKPEPIPPINHEKPIMKDTETNTNDEFKAICRFIKFFKHISYRIWNSKRFASLHQALQAHLVQILELKAIRLLHQNLKKQIVNFLMNVKLKKKDIG